MPQHLKSMERKPSERDKESSILAEDKVEAFFPLSLFVDDPEIEKLGISGIDVGDERTLIATVKATSVSINESEGSEKREHVTLTIIEAAIESQSQAEKLFDED